MSEPYENIYIGSFILALGYRLGCKGEAAEPLASVNLYQQTPGDPLIGDLLAALSGKSTIIEFKRNRIELRTETQKSSFSIRRDMIFEDMFDQLSRSCHFAGYGHLEESGNGDLRFFPYLDLPLIDDGHIPQVSLNPFHDRLLNGTIGADHELFLRYLDYLSSAGGGHQMPILIVNVSHHNRVTLISAQNIKVALECNLKISEPELEAPKVQQKKELQKQEKVQVRIRG